MRLDECLEAALRSPEPINELRSLALRLLSEGHDKTALLGEFERMRQQLRQTDREADEDAVMDAMDFLVGWCSPHMKLPPEPGAPAGI
jgi:hypothetical protein